MYKVKGNIILFLIIILSLNGYAQFYTQENIEEAKDMVTICNSFTFLSLYKTDNAIIPSNYKKTFTSGVFGMDNKYQVYQTSSKAVINLRGSTTKKISWMENIYSSMIPAEGHIVLQEDTFFYKFSKDASAGVHAGYALGIAFLANDIIHQIKSLNYDGIYNITITGHSQGGALAILLRAYLENLPKGKISEKNHFKTYAFAHPKVGNQEFVKAYLENCKNGSNYSIINVKDFIPKMPLNSRSHKSMSSSESISRVIFDKSYTVKDAAMGTLGKMFGGSLASVMKYTSESALKQITKKVGEVTMPLYIADVEYSIMGNRIELTEFEYPKILKDPSILKNDSLKTYHKYNTEGVFEDESVYKSEPTLFQHKTYNYYAGFLKKYYPREYDMLKVKILLENL